MKFKNSTEQGNLSEQLVSIEFMKKGFEVYHNIGENNKFDFIVFRSDVGLKTVQVKSTNCEQNDVKKKGYSINLRHTRRRYSDSSNFDINHLDIFAAVILPEDKIFYFDCADNFLHKTHIRFSKKNIKSEKFIENLEELFKK